MHRSTKEILRRIYLRPLAVQANFARREAATIGYLASTGFITTWEGKGDEYGRFWRATPCGIEALDVPGKWVDADPDEFMNKVLFPCLYPHPGTQNLGA